MDTLIKNHSKKYFVDLSKPIRAEIGNKYIQAMILPHAGTLYVQDIFDTAFHLCPVYDRIILLTTNHWTHDTLRYDPIDPHDLFLQEHSFLSIFPYLEKFSRSYDIYAIGNNTFSDIGKNISSSETVLWIANTDLLHCYERVSCKQTMTENDLNTISFLKQQKLPPNGRAKMCGYQAIRVFFQKIKKLHLEWKFMSYTRSDHIVESSAVGYTSILFSSDSGSTVYNSLSSRYALTKIREYKTYRCLTIKSEVPNIKGVFVTLFLHGQLYGCIGTFNIPNGNIVDAISDMGYDAAFHDRRFHHSLNVAPPEDISAHVTFIGELQICSSFDDFMIGKHGILIQFQPSQKTATYLASVLIEHFQISEKNKHEKFPELFESLLEKAGISYYTTYTLFRYECL
jgi:AMMECR1 domain-containing protein/predicted class III extradiol MEMO1 family dioxygenase